MADENPSKSEVPADDAPPVGDAVDVPSKEAQPDAAKNDTKGSKASSQDDGPFLASYGNAGGDKVQSILSPIGKPIGKGLETVTKPVGGVVDAVVGGLVRSGAAYGEVAGVGAGNQDKKKAEEKAERHEPVGGQEQTAKNPLGL